ncbi:hypothetical protein T261_0918 [Streptomyces lydicus]|nr:hypothetical protein T261_0918 [Streptomyces lydicus]
MAFLAVEGEAWRTVRGAIGRIACGSAHAVCLRMRAWA